MAYRERDSAVTSTTKTAPSATDRSARSVFVGNISYEVGEEQLKQVFAQVGPVVHLRLVHDRDTGKPKGYGFCEYNDAQTAESAIRNLNGFELNGRPLRVDSAAGGDRSADEVQQLQAAFAAQQQEYLQQQAQESPYGPETEADKVPEAISRSVASLPPEQMFELMKQMKQCVHNNPNEAKNLLMNNPQLAYALLQAQVVMRIVDPQVAVAMLHRETPAISQPFHQQQQQQAYPDTSVPVSMSTVPNIPQPMFPGGMPQMAPSAASSVPVNFARPPSGPAVTRAPSPQGTNSELSPDDQQQAQLLMQVLQLSEEQIALLPPDDRRKVIELRNQLRSSV
ncbi:cleavage stimulation factor [Loa loa]|uniref:Cleavage stimulation factor n=1 Tax=Loa loa TaxID=7209 RepID=A0A1I7V8Y2_LOALO|nr:cleavage stimulation factor [Loa loa]EFO15894.2 cleavage stimulation factor [Loa loa]